MSSRLHNAVRDALSLVRKSNLVEATALIRAALASAKTAPPHEVSNSNLLSAALPQSTAEETYTWKRKETRKSVSEKAPETYGGTGQFTSRNYHHVERDLTYMLYIPSNNSGNERSLLLMLHGCTQNPKDFALGTQMNRLADEFNIIVAYPLQPQSANSSGCWNWFDERHQKHGSGEPAMLASLAENLSGEFNISDKRVFAAGLSAGGAMAEILASTYPQQFAAVGVHSGLPHGAATSLVNAFSAMKGSSKFERRSRKKGTRQSRRIVFHGSSDATVHPSNGERIVNQSRQDSIKLKEIEITNVINGRNVSRTILEDQNGMPIVEQWVVTGGGHAWFGGNSRGSYSDPKGPDASREMVRFFLMGKY